MNQPLVRLATRDDVKSIVDFNRSMAMETENISLDKAVITQGVEAIFDNSKHGFYIVCELEDKVRACLMISYEWSDWRNGLFWWIQSVFVQKEFRQQGLYKSMYDFIKTKADLSEGIAGIRLYVDQNNTKAQSVYTKLGMIKSNYQLFEYVKVKKN